MAKKCETQTAEPAEEQTPQAAESVVFATVEQLREAYPELVSQIEAAMVVASAQELRELYPVLVGEITEQASQQVAAAAEAMTAEQIKLNLPAVFQTVAEAVVGKAPQRSKGPGFLLEVDDPFAAGALGTYCKLTGSEDLRLPYVLPYKKPGGKGAVASYIQRASGAGDTARAQLARKALAKCK